MNGFFSKQELENKTKIQFNIDDFTKCNQCGLYKKCNSPRMGYSGQGKRNTFILSESPGNSDDRLGKTLIGSTGKYFRNKLFRLNLDLERDFYRACAVNCFSDKENISDSEINNCRSYVQYMIEQTNPNHIWAMGVASIKSLLGETFNDVSITQFRGLCVPDQKYKKWISFLHDPEFARNNDNNRNIQALYDRDLKRAISKIRKDSFPSYELNEKKVRLVFDYNDLIKLLTVTNQLPEGTVIVIDYETSGLKPFRNGHFIATISITVEHNTYSFPLSYRNFWTHEQEQNIKLHFKKILLNNALLKVAHNLKFEHLWSKVVFDAHQINWHWDTMTGARIQDNRRRFSGLKFQSYVNYGIHPYDTEISKFLKTDDEEFNSVEEAPLKDLLVYNGYDTLLCRKLYVDQQVFYENYPSYKPAIDLFHEGDLSFADLQYEGICVDEEYYKKQYDILGKKIRVINKRIKEGPEAQKFKEQFGKPVDWASNKDLGVLFYDVLKAHPLYTEKGNYRVNKNALEETCIPIANRILQLRKLEKTRGTYVKQILREVCNGRIHPFFDLGISSDDAGSPVTYRSTSSKPNFHNIPVRDKEVSNICRGGIIPSPGFKMLDSDFGGIEVCIGACYHKDPNMIKYITDPSTDMHRDCACDIWMLSPEEVTKDIRFYAKNGWTFAQFYGDYYIPCAKSMWANVWVPDLKTVSGKSIRQHMAEKGITKYSQFEEHCKEVERIFWYDRFSVYREWREDINKFYIKHGFIESLLGFRFTGLMERNKVTNYQTQGTAFHIMLWTLNKLIKESKAEKLRSKQIGQIHDDIVTNLCPDEESYVINKINRIGTEDVRNEFSWIIVPLTIEHELTEIDKPWSTKKELMA